MKHCFAVCICLFSSFVMAVAQEGGIVESASLDCNPFSEKPLGILLTKR
ncbi:hypothetical protein Pan181_38780 [Aeoliella mucimassa]|uniref:Uncharacterized protein n=1 Tax=Aeoliella mucimassa TaxID=2527972 RepID=A0A518ASG7_9BACT|nr:hypothetical protein Pan181_38780 [Aeoliella mucimassa]